MITVTQYTLPTKTKKELRRFLRQRKRENGVFDPFQLHSCPFPAVQEYPTKSSRRRARPKDVIKVDLACSNALGVRAV
jgi:hypothetical protein